ncbi:hypothetical protein [Hoeflea poritis]|uniref:Uncharacterized protein n=1 Tax=Hoeflea poritis TaxID=2993659 RepID=A0ABT4VH13_9HYPH|nr:hypothetical protein [Hoeflea poritis]MDA4843991.1 hypothetical protein [Hoeflea poritis]
MADAEITGSKDLLRSFFYLYDKSPSFRKILSDPQWQKRRFKKIELVWVEGPTYPRWPGGDKPTPFVATSRVVGDDNNRTWRMEINRHLMGQIRELAGEDSPLTDEDSLVNHVRPMTLEETIAHEMAHALYPAASVGEMLTRGNEREVPVVEKVNEIRRDLRLRRRRIKDPKDLRHIFQRAKHYNEPWVEGVYTKEENIRRTTGWRAHPVLAPANYESKLWKRRGEGGDSREAQPETRPKSTTLRGQEPVSEPPRLQLDPTVHRLLSGDLSALDPQNGPFSPNLLRLLMGGNVPRVKGATRLHDIARVPANRVGR